MYAEDTQNRAIKSRAGSGRKLTLSGSLRRRGTVLTLCLKFASVITLLPEKLNACCP